MKLAQIILSNIPNRRNPLSWIPFILIMVLMIPIFMLMVILIPLVLIFNFIKLRFFPNKTPKTFVTSFGFAAYSQVNRTIVNYPWHDIEKVEIWAEKNNSTPVLIITGGEAVKLKNVSIDQIRILCDKHNITFYEEVVIVNSESER